MKISIKGKDFRIEQILFLIIYYGFAQYLPNSYCVIKPLGGK